MGKFPMNKKQEIQAEVDRRLALKSNLSPLEAKLEGYHRRETRLLIAEKLLGGVTLAIAFTLIAFGFGLMLEIVLWVVK